MLRLAILAPLLLAAAAPAAAPPKPAPEVLAPSGAYRADPDHSSILFRVKHLGMAWFTARFNAFTVDLGFDAATPEKSSLAVSVDTTSVQSGVAPKASGSFDNDITSDKRWLDATTYPRMTFVAKRIVRTGPATAAVTGDLTLRGVTKPVTLAATFNGSLKAHPFSKKPVLGFSATGTLKRSDFGMTYLMPMVGDEVQIVVEAELVTK